MDFLTENDTLSRISKALYGDALTLAVMDPKDISLLKKNARILKRTSSNSSRRTSDGTSGCRRSLCATA